MANILIGQMKKITKKTSFAEVIEKYPESQEVFSEIGMHCVACPMAMMETLEQGCEAHGVDVDQVIKILNKKLGKNEKRRH